MKKTIKTLAVFGLIISGIYFGKWFIQTDYFKIREIPVTGYKKTWKNDKGRCKSKKCHNSEDISK